MSLLSSMKEEAIVSFRTLDTLGKMDAMEVKAKVASARTQLNLANMLHDLPAVIKETEAIMEQNQAKKLAFVQSQEKGEI